MASVPRPPFYVPRQSDDFIWTGPTRQDSTIRLLTAVKFFGAPGQAPTKRWRYDHDAESVWIGKPDASVTISLLAHQKFFGAPGQAPTKQWRYDYDVAEIGWLAQPDASAVLGLLTHQKFFGAGGQAPTVRYRQDIDVGEAFWTGKPVPRNASINAVNNPTIPLAWKFGYSDDAFWQSGSKSSALLAPILTVGGQVKQSHWFYSTDDLPPWQQPASLNLGLLTATPVKPFSNLSFQFNSLDDPSSWQQLNIRNLGMLTAVIKPITNPFQFNLVDEVAPYKQTLSRNLPLVGAFPTGHAWRFNFADEPAPPSLISNRNLALLSKTPFVGQPWRFTSVDEAALYSLVYRSNIALTATPFRAPRWSAWTTDEPAPASAIVMRNAALLTQQATPIKINLSSQTTAYSEDAPWLAGPMSSRILIPTLTAGGKVKPFRWNWTLDDPPSWARTIRLNQALQVTPPPTPAVAPSTWKFGYYEEAPWVPFKVTNFEILTPPIPPFVLDFDPRFLASPNAFLPSPIGAARVTVVTPDTREQVASPVFYPREFVTSPTVTGNKSMPYGNDFSPIDPTIELVTLTFNFAPWLSPGVTITSVLSVAVVNSTLSDVQDPNPSEIISGSSQIGPSPVTGAAGTAVLQQVTSCQANVTYLLQCLVQTSDNQKLNLASRLPCALLN